jgi:L-alanine-DL-glutamate epimerase-like enolase superfamily enzyme
MAHNIEQIMRIDRIDVRPETWPLNVPFRISRGAKAEAAVVTVELQSGSHVGRGECCPYPRYGESIEQTLATLNQLDLNAFDVRNLADLRNAMIDHLPPGSARNAVDCALWDLEAKATGHPVWQLAGLPSPQAQLTCFTLSLDRPDAMAEDALRHADCPLLKLKLGESADTDVERIQAVRTARPDARLVCDVNEGWQPNQLSALVLSAAACGMELIEQPLPGGSDEGLAALSPAVPVCADESAFPGSLPSSLAGRYQAVNIKLDKTGGLTAALTAISDARRAGLKIMIGSMVTTSLSMAPAALLAGLADWVDLDSPLLLAKDRTHAMHITGGYLSAPSPALWG